MASISRFIHAETFFDDQTTRLLAHVYDAVCAKLSDTSQPDIAREVVARPWRRHRARRFVNATRLETEITNQSGS
jgi:hypothetical protein